MVFNHYLGIDISKKTLDAALLLREGVVEGQIKVSNDKKGFMPRLRPTRPGIPR